MILRNSLTVRTRKHTSEQRIRFLGYVGSCEANLFCTTIVVLRCRPIFDRATINRFRLNSKRLPAGHLRSLKRVIGFVCCGVRNVRTKRTAAAVCD